MTAIDVIRQAVDAVQQARPDLKARPMESGGYVIQSNGRSIARIGLFTQSCVFVASISGIDHMTDADKASPQGQAAILLHAIEDAERELAA